MKKFFAVVLLAIGMLSFQSISAGGSSDPRIISVSATTRVYVGDIIYLSAQYTASIYPAYELYCNGEPVYPGENGKEPHMTINEKEFCFWQEAKNPGGYQYVLILRNRLGEDRVGFNITVEEIDDEDK